MWRKILQTKEKNVAQTEVAIILFSSSVCVYKNARKLTGGAGMVSAERNTGKSSLARKKANI